MPSDTATINLMEAARRLRPVLQRRAQACDEARCVPAESMQDLRQAGFIRALGPQHFGGCEHDLPSFFEAIIELAKGCPSTAWTTSVLGIHTWMADLFPESTQIDVWPDGDCDVVIASALAPLGRLTQVEGGFRLSGHWRYSSGIDHADWVIVGASFEKNRPGGHERFECLVPATDYEVRDTWFSTGLRGTGSNDVLIENAFVPVDRTLSLARLFAGRAPTTRSQSSPLASLPWMPVFVYGLTAPSIGIAEAALAEHVAQAEGGRAAYTGARAAENPALQMRLAEAAAKVDAARLILQRDLAEIASFAERHERCPAASAVRYRWDGPYIVSLCHQAIEAIIIASGAPALLEASPLQRSWRDIQAMSQHAILNADIAAQIYGRHLLGLPSDPTLF